MMQKLIGRYETGENPMFNFIIGLTIGVCLGLIVAALLGAAHRDERDW